MGELRRVKEIFDKIAGVSGKKSKETIIKQNADNELFLECLKFLLDSNITTGLSKKKINKKVKVYENTCDDIRDMFDYVRINNTGTDRDIGVVQGYINSLDEDIQDFVRGLFTKSLKIGADAKTVNKVIPGLISTFEIMLGSKADLNKLPKGDKFVTEKFDGCRCFTQIRNGKIIMKSRQNKMFEGLIDIENSIKELGLNNMSLDGELLAIDSNYENVYKDTMKIVSTKEKEKHGVKYMIFDILPIDEFDNKKGVLKYSERRKILDNIKQNEFISITPVLYHGTDNDKVLEVLSICRANGAEGAMINLDKPYEFKRSKTLLKLKIMNTCDLKIIGFEEGSGKFKGTLGNLICDYKGYQLGVGSGFDDKQREQIWNNQEEYLNRIAEIQYFEETYNDKGGLSLRFPVFKCIRELGKEVSYN
ncbi:MAG: RNA ligase family protein [Clostridia bacterium]